MFEVVCFSDANTTVPWAAGLMLESTFAELPKGGGVNEGVLVIPGVCVVALIAMVASLSRPVTFCMEPCRVLMASEERGSAYLLKWNSLDRVLWDARLGNSSGGSEWSLLSTKILFPSMVLCLVMSEKRARS